MTTPYIFSAPRNGSTPVVERLEWLTDVQTSRNGTEVRRGRRAYPRYTYTFDIYVASDISRACLQALRTETSFLVPLWAHVFERPDRAPSAGIAYSAPQLMQLDHAGARQITNATSITWAAGYDVAAPCIVARYAGSQRSFSHVVPGKVATSSVSFRLENFREAVNTYPPNVTGSTIRDITFLTSAGGGLAEQITDNANNFDNGNIDLYESKYLERIYNVSIVLNTRANIVVFRRLLFWLQGRLNPLFWTAPGDTVRRTWRLASDSVDITYLRPGLATCTLSLKQISA
jgi:hypothetical protein